MNALILLLCGSVAFTSGGVRVPEDGFADRVVSIESGEVVQRAPAPDAFAEHVRSQLPPDDRGAWYITVFTVPNSGDSALLMRDIRESPALQALARWGTVNVIDYSTEAERERWKKAGIRYTPTVLVYPRPNHPRLPFRYVMAQEGYGGDADLLARNIYSAVRRVYTKYNIQGPCPGPYCPQPNKPDVNPYTPNNDNWPPMVPVPKVPDAGISFDFGLGGLVAFAIKAVVVIVALFIALAILPALLKMGLKYTKRQLHDIASAVTDTDDSGTGGKSAK